MLYETLLCIGFLGLLAQTVLGFMHGGHGGEHHGHGPGNGYAHGSHGGHAAGNGGHAAHGHATHHVGHHGSHAAGDHHSAPGHHSHEAHGPGNATKSLSDTALAGSGMHTAEALMALLSPLTLFSVSLGAGATGVLLKGHLKPALLVAVLAALGGILFYRYAIRPVWNLILGFVSRPAEALAGVVAGEAEAVSRFDTQGKGVVRVTIDGQLVRLLAHLEPEDIARGVTVGQGDKLVVTHVDGRANSCRVTRL